MIIKREYIKDIDGLRALAVLSVILYHLNYSFISGGFVGVDIFFVISGYLITKNILFDIEKSSFSFFDFYMRRARRLFPALFVTLIISTILAWMLFTPVDLERFGKSLLYANLSLSNFFFMSEAGYFDSSSSMKPLLHTWSLSVEEQYYLIWPFILVVVSRFRSLYLLLFLVISAILSLYASHIASSEAPTAGFYMLPFRVFEFALGALVIWLESIEIKRGWIYDILMLSGIGMILYSMLFFTHKLPFPDLIALIPSLGAAIVIYASSLSFVGRVFRYKYIVGIGAISYSLYLVHWPIIIYYKYWKFDDMTNIERVLYLFLIFGLAWLMWRFVEQRYRLARGADAKTHFSLMVPSLMLLVTFVAANIWGYRGFPDRYPSMLHMSTEELQKERDRYWSATNDELKINGSSDADYIILMGNSHANDLVYALKENGSDLNIEFLSTTHHCSNFGTLANAVEYVELCDKIKNRNFLNSEWSDIDRVYLHDDWITIDMPSLKQTLLDIRKLTKAPIYIFGPKMRYTEQVPVIIAKSITRKSPKDFILEYQDSSLFDINSKLIKLFDENYYREKNIYYIDLLGTQCDSGPKSCEVISKDRRSFYYFDFSHFTKEGAIYFGQKLKKRYPYLF